MGEPLLCPKCKEGTMKWIDPNLEDLLDEGIMECCKCKAQFKGIPGWVEAMYGKDIFK
jgi:ribosomal protein L37AE/L43A